MVAITQTNTPKTHYKGSIFHVELHKVFGEPDDMIAKLSFVNLVCVVVFKETIGGVVENKHTL